MSREQFYRLCPVCNIEYHILEMEITYRKDKSFYVCPECGHLILFKNQ